MDTLKILLSVTFISFVLLFYVGITPIVVRIINRAIRSVRRKNLTLTKRSNTIIFSTVILTTAIFIISLIQGNYVIVCGIMAFCVGFLAVFKNLGATVAFQKTPLFKIYYTLTCLPADGMDVQSTLNRICFNKREIIRPLAFSLLRDIERTSYEPCFDKILASGNIEVKNE